MAGESLFRDLKIEAFRAGITPRTKESIRWFKDKARQMFRGRFTFASQFGPNVLFEALKSYMYTYIYIYI